MSSFANGRFPWTRKKQSSSEPLRLMDILRPDSSLIRFSQFHDKALSADASTATGEKDTRRARSESSNEVSSRQQLPSLHSLFGQPYSIRSLHSASERESLYLAQSPLDRSRILPGVGSNSTSYFPPTASPPVSQPRRTYDSRLEAHSLARCYSEPRSPKYYERQRSRSDSRAKCESSKWSAHQHVSRYEHSWGSRHPTLQSLDSRARTQLSTSKDSSRDYSGQRSTQPRSSGPPTPEGSAASEGAPTKDSLGPRIWTGTHFLPRFVRAADVPGEGMCYFYDDGSHCKTAIDGEAVNAHWGVTKAGKPRKRLAIACITCREKKIKCDPDYPRCVQCEKFGRICKFKNAPRGGHNTSPSTPPAELDDRRKMVGSSRQNDGRLSTSGPTSPVSPRVVLQQPSPETGYSKKRLKIGSDAYATNGEPSVATTQPMDHSKSSLSIQQSSSELPRIPDDVLHRAWRTDPYVSNPQSISAVLSQFFGHIDNSIVIRFLPEDIFKSWVASSAHRKSPDDMMLLYSILAIGVVLSGGPRDTAFEYAQVAHYAQKSSTTPSLHLVQSRILLALYNVAASRFSKANELISSATATGAYLQLNEEIDRSKDADLAVYPFGMTRKCYAETRRRTLWSLFMLERLSPLFPKRPTMIHAEDIHIRLPSDSESFERQLDDTDAHVQPIRNHLVEIVHVWSSCQSIIHRLASRPNGSNAEGLQVRTLTKRIHDWHSALPSRLSFGTSNLELAAFSGKVGSFLTMHLLCHHALIQLNRYHLSVGKLSAEYRSSHLQECLDNARNIIDVMGCLDRLLRIRPTILSTPSPAMAIAVITAMDVLTLSGPPSVTNDVIDCMRIAKAAVDSSADIWEHAQTAQIALDQRLQKLYRIRDHGSRESSANDFCVTNFASDGTKPDHGQILRRLDQTYPICMDVVYCSQ
ncbi:Zn(2)-Cys(6) zinc finger domain protein [Metarhizium robertsii]|uniref:Zn(2)-Cys(6) zinc finger domain protein n=1 Tax=Metarhizium robertsii TaxID=568076 RepID=A0A014P0J7_9HYPO|nr:Zn(2)-Cys(6) zinc finger domain protein [Metarhizium robertsii]